MFGLMFFLYKLLSLHEKKFHLTVNIKYQNNIVRFIPPFRNN